MSVDLHALIPLIALTFLLAGFVKGVVGLGLPTVSVGLLGLAMPPMQAAALLIVPSMVTNLWQLACGPRFLGLMKRLAGLLFGGGRGHPAGRRMARRRRTKAGHRRARPGPGGLRAARPGRDPAAPAGTPRALGRPAGRAGDRRADRGHRGFRDSRGALPGSPRIAARRTGQALGLSFNASTLALAVTLGVHGDLLEPQMLGASLLTLVPALCGMLLGQWLRQRISAALFRRCFFVGLLLLGADLAWRGFH